MYSEIYIDVVFVTNFLVDFLLLRIIGRLFLCRKSRGRCLLAAAMGALFSCLILYIPTEIPSAGFALLHGMCGLWMLWLGCGLKKSGLLIKAMATLYMTAFLLGGFWEVVTEKNGITLKTFVLSAAGAYLGTTAFVCMADSLRSGFRSVYPVTLSYQGQAASTYGFYDSGNLLTDFLDGRPVSFVQPEFLDELLTKDGAEKLKHLTEDPGELKNTQLAGMRPHFLSCRTVGAESTLVLAVTLDDLIIHTPREAVHVSQPVFALSAEPFALGKEYKVLLNSKLLH